MIKLIDNYIMNSEFDEDLFPAISKRNYFELLKSLFRGVRPPRCISRMEWNKIEDDLGVKLPLSYKNMFDLFSDGYLGNGLLWKSPAAKNNNFKLSKEELASYADLYSDMVNGIHLYPNIPGYLVFATTPLAIDMAYFVDFNADENKPFCQKNVILLDCKASKIEKTNVEIDEFIYRSIKNKPRLNGALSRHIHKWTFADSSIPLYQFFD